MPDPPYTCGNTTSEQSRQSLYACDLGLISLKFGAQFEHDGPKVGLDRFMIDCLGWVIMPDPSACCGWQDILKMGESVIRYLARNTILCRTV
jgi:hypothetical protein